MALGTDVICSLSAENNTETLGIVLAVIFGVYILFDSILGALTVGSKAWAPYYYGAAQATQKGDLAAAKIELT